MGVNYNRIGPCYSNPSLGVGGVAVGGIGTNPILYLPAGGVAIGGVPSNPIVGNYSGGVAIGGEGSQSVLGGSIGGVAVGGIGLQLVILASGGVAVGGVGSNPMLYSPSGGVGIGGVGSEYGILPNPPYGGIGVGGTGVNNNPIPGTTCAGRTPILPGITYGPYTVTDGPTQDWWQADTPTGSGFHVTLNVISGSNSNATIYSNCNVPITGWVSGCQYWFGNSGIFSIHQQIIGPGQPVFTYTFSWDNGTC